MLLTDAHCSANFSPTDDGFLFAVDDVFDDRDTDCFSCDGDDESLFDNVDITGHENFASALEW